MKKLQDILFRFFIRIYIKKRKKDGASREQVQKEIMDFLEKSGKLID